MTPTAEFWAEFPIIAIIALVVLALSLGIKKVWEGFSSWQATQDEKRQIERDKQREWQERLLASQEKNADRREERWQGIYREMVQQLASELRGLREDLGNHHQVALQIKDQLDKSSRVRREPR